MRGVNSSRVVLSNAPAGVKLSGAYLMNHGIEPELTGDYDSAYDFFLGAQQRDFQCGVVYSPEEAFADPHFVAREFPTSVAHPELDREIAYPGAPFKSSTDGWRISRRPPLVGEHTEEVLEDIPWRDAPRGLPSKKG